MNSARHLQISFVASQHSPHGSYITRHSNCVLFLFQKEDGGNFQLLRLRNLTLFCQVKSCFVVVIVDGGADTFLFFALAKSNNRLPSKALTRQQK
jgi:hypothetical protein